MGCWLQRCHMALRLMYLSIERWHTADRNILFCGPNCVMRNSTSWLICCLQTSYIDKCKPGTMISRYGLVCLTFCLIYHYINSSTIATFGDVCLILLYSTQITQIYYIMFVAEMSNFAINQSIVDAYPTI